MERSRTTRLRRDQEHSTGELLTMMSELVSVGTGMFGTSGVVAVCGGGCLLACAIIAISGVVAAWLAALIAGAALLAAAGGSALLGRRRLRKAAPPVPEEAVAGVRADIGEIKERAHR
jgi:membrane protein